MFSCLCRKGSYNLSKFTSGEKDKEVIPTSGFPPDVPNIKDPNDPKSNNLLNLVPVNNDSQPVVLKENKNINDTDESLQVITSALAEKEKIESQISQNTHSTIQIEESKFTETKQTISLNETFQNQSLTTHRDSLKTSENTFENEEGNVYKKDQYDPSLNQKSNSDENNGEQKTINSLNEKLLSNEGITEEIFSRNEENNLMRKVQTQSTTEFNEAENTATKGSDDEEIETSENVFLSDNEFEDHELSTKRRSGLAGKTVNVEENSAHEIQIPKHTKHESDEKLIKEAIAKNDFLKHLERERLQGVVDAMYSRDVKADEVIINEGSVGTELYISATGIFEIIVKGETVFTFSDNRVFGELAILYDAKRQATVKALQNGSVWVLDQNVYLQLMFHDEIEQRNQLINFLKKVPKLNTVEDRVLGRVADLLQLEFFETGTCIVKQGDPGDKFYIISAGVVTVSKKGEGEINKMTSGEYFGELALLTEDVRQATVTAEAPGVECLSLSRQHFREHFGNVEDIGNIHQTERKSTVPVVNPYEHIELFDFKRVGILGVGGFGRVELLQHKTQKDLTFAIKILKKSEMVHLKQEQHVFNEKVIQLSCNTRFIARLYKTFRDNKYLYFLLEPCLGGDLWSLLQQQRARRFDENTSRFYAASVLEAFAYLHEHSIVYRDLKPENLLLVPNGYLKLTDFGFAKKLGPRGKTYTFAGTPEYVPPEIILLRGHDYAVDYWTLGIFIYELLVGKTPFRSSDPDYLKTYNMILRGIENARFPDFLSRKAESIIKRLCKSMPTERLGCQKSGPQAVRDHRWFNGFDWNQLRAGEMKAPMKRSIKGSIDLRYFDKFEKDTDIPPDEISGWDVNF